SASSFYCCGVLKSTTLSIGEAHSTSAKANGKTDNCCKTTKRSFKVKDHYCGAGSSFVLAKSLPVFAPFTSLQLSDEPFAEAYTTFNSHGPPFRQHEPIYILNCTFRM